MAKEEQSKEEASAPNKKKLFIIIGAAVAAVLVIVVAVVLLSGGKKGKDKEAGHEAKTEQKAEAGKSGHGGGSAPAIYPLEPFIVNIYDGQEIRYLKVKVEFGTLGPETKAELDSKQAPLRDAILVLLTTKTLQDVQDLQGKNHLRDEILAAVNKIVPGKVQQIFFTDFVVQ